MEVLSNEGTGERVGCNPEDMEDVLPASCEVVIHEKMK